jgi:outer membrane receptor protein involved in Fe transport
MRKNQFTRRVAMGSTSCIIALALASTFDPVFAQAPSGDGAQAQSSVPQADTENPGMGEIVVTATRQAQTLNRVPLSIVAKDQETLDKQGVRSIADVARLTPGINFGQTSLNYGTGQSVISIRGIQSDSGIPTTGVYIDDTPVQTRIGISPSLTNAYPQIFDLDRVEVLRGPQGTLFGSGSVGGALRFITPEPSFDDVSLYARSELATTKHGSESYEAGLAVGAPIVEDKLGFRASGWYRHDGGYVDRLDRYTKELVDKDIDGQDNYSLRLALGWRPTETLTLVPSIYFQKTSFDDSSRFELATSDIGNANYRTSLARSPESRKDRFYLPALKATLDLGDLSLVSNTSYLWRKTNTLSDDVALSLALFGGWAEADFPAGFENYSSGTDSVTYQKAFTQEVRLQKSDPNGRFNFVLGLFYQKSKVSDTFKGIDPDALQAINLGQSLIGEPPLASVGDAYGFELYQGIYSNYQSIRHDDEQKAVFAQVDYEVVPRVKLTAGLRYTIADYTYTGFAAGPFTGTDGTTTVSSSRGKPLTPKFGISFQADRNNLFYVNAAKGVRGSGIAPAVGQNCSADAAAIGFNPLQPTVIKPDSIWSYEIGSKNRLLNGKLLVDVAAYRVNWKNIQTLFNLPSCSIYTALNFGEAKIDGVDLSVTVAPIRQLTLGASVSYTNARYTSPLIGAGDTVIRRAGEPFPVAPWSIQLNGEVRQPIGNNEGYLRADFTYTSHNDKPLDLTSPLVDPDLPRAPATTMLNLRAGLRLNRDIDVSLFVNNVTNSHPVMSLYHDLPGAQMYRASSFRPRTFGLTATIRR